MGGIEQRHQEGPAVSVWGLIRKAECSYDPDQHTETLRYCDEAEVRYHFTAVDPSQPAASDELIEREVHLFGRYDEALAVYEEWCVSGYLAGPLTDYEGNVPLVVQWIPEFW